MATKYYYRYNKFVLPDIDEVWTDKETYPYAIIDNFGNLKFGKSVHHELGKNDNTWRVVLSDAKVYTANEKWEYAHGAIAFSSPLANVGWANFNVLNEDGSVYLAASRPVLSSVEPAIVAGDFYKYQSDAVKNQDVYKVINKKWVKQPQAGFVVRDGKWVLIETVENEPVGDPIAYEFNGHRLPPLPDYDKKEYPYALIDNPNHILIIGKSVKYSKTSNGYTIYFSGDCLNYIVDETSDRWIIKPDNGQTVVGNAIKNIIWANTDVLNEDGTVYLKASDPVPVYE